MKLSECFTATSCSFSRDSAAFLVRSVVAFALLVARSASHSQAVSPVIVEYQGTAEGRIALTNDSLVPMAVSLEPRSFSISSDGGGLYRPLDRNIHIKMSAASFQIAPGDTRYVFYKAKADFLPAWFTIYSTFSALRKGADTEVRVALPHTVYIYRKGRRPKGTEVEVKRASYLRDEAKVVCELANTTVDLERVEEIWVNSKGRSIVAPGFPLLPGSTRHVEVDWKDPSAPIEVVLRMEHSTLKLPLEAHESSSSR